MKNKIENAKKLLLLTLPFVILLFGICFFIIPNYMKILSVTTLIVVYIQVMLFAYIKSDVSIRKKRNNIFVISTIVLLSIFFIFIFMNRTIVGNANYLLLSGCAAILCTFSICTCVNILIFNKEKIHYAFLEFFLGLGIIYMALIPVSMVPDETVHLFSAYHTSNVLMGIEESDNCKESGCAMMRESDAHGYNMKARDYHLDEVISVLEQIDDPIENTTIVEGGWQVIYGSEYLFIPCSIGITIGRVAQLGTVSTFLLGRVFNFVFYLIVTTYAIKLLPIGKLLLLILASTPMSLQQGMSYSYDCIINASAFLVIAYTIDMCMNKERCRKVYDYCLIGIFSLLLFFAKGHAYAPIAILPLAMLLFNKVSIPEKKLKKMILITVGSVIAIFLLIILSLLIYDNHNLLPYTENILEYSGLPSYTIPYLINNPMEIIRMIYCTIRYMGLSYVNSFVGSQLGWLEVNLSAFVVHGEQIVLLLATIFSSSKYIPTSRRLTMLIASLLSVACIFAGLLLYWTHIGAPYVLGVQGRYFIALALPLLLSISGLECKESTQRYIIIIHSILSLLAILDIIKWFVR